MMTSKILIQTISISTALVASGGIATLSLFDVPILQSQSAQHSLPSIRWLFSRGSHIFPQAALLSSAGFAYLAYAVQPVAQRGLLSLLKVGNNPSIVNGYLFAAALAMSIGPFTSFVMIPTNFELIKMNAQRGGSRSELSAAKGGGGDMHRSAEDSVNGLGEVNQFTDLSGPQNKTIKATSKDDEKKVRNLLEKFKLMNWGRALLLGSGGMVGLLCALS